MTLHEDDIPLQQESRFRGMSLPQTLNDVIRVGLRAPHQRAMTIETSTWAHILEWTTTTSANSSSILRVRIDRSAFRAGQSSHGCRSRTSRDR